MNPLPKTPGASARSGFTLLEVLIAVVVLSTGIVVVLRAIQTSLSALGHARDSLVATQIAAEQIAEAEAAVRLAPGSAPSPSWGMARRGSFDYRWELAVREVGRPEPAAAAGGRLYELTISVRRDGVEIGRASTATLRCPPSGSAGMPPASGGGEGEVVTAPLFYSSERRGTYRASGRAVAGFTLIELLVATAIMALVLAAIVACLTAGVQAWDAARTVGLLEADSMVFTVRFERDLMNTFPFRGAPLAGDSVHLAIPALADPPDGAGEGGERTWPATVTYRHDPVERAVIREWRLHPSGRERRERVLAWVERFELEYEAPAGAGGRSGPKTVWNDTTNLPSVVRLRLGMRDGRAAWQVDRAVVLPLAYVQPTNAPAL